MQFDGVTFDTLSSVEVVIEGEWKKGTSRDWVGKAISQVPLLAICFLDAHGTCHWCKSERDQATPRVRLALFPYDSIGIDVQVNFSVGGGGRRNRTIVSSPSYRPEIPNRIVCRTGRIFTFTKINANPDVDLHVLFIVRGDVESSRNTLWRVRAKFVETISDVFRNILTKGRTGVIASA